MLARKSDYIGLDDGRVHLATGGQPPLLVSHRAAFEAFAADKARGTEGYDQHWRVGERVRTKLATLTGLPAADHALVGSASEGLARVVSSIDWRPGDTMVVSDRDYASGRFAALRLAGIGVEPRLVPARGWVIDEGDLIDAVDDTTRLVYVSEVTSLTGQRLDIRRLSDALGARNVPLVVDASHALGVVPVDATLADFTITACYKFLCATHMGVLAWNRARRPDFEPLTVGWASGTDAADGRSYALHETAARAHVGNSNHLDVYLLDTSLDHLLGFGIEAVSAHVMRLAGELRAGLVAAGLDVVTPGEPHRHAGNIVFAEADDAGFVARAAADGFLLWDGGGRVRASVHLFNDGDDVRRFLAWVGRAAG